MGKSLVSCFFETQCTYICREPGLHTDISHSSTPDACLTTNICSYVFKTYKNYQQGRLNLGVGTGPAHPAAAGSIIWQTRIFFSVQSTFVNVKWPKTVVGLEKLHTLWSIDLHEISKFDATRCEILRLKCTKFDFRWGSAPDPAGEAYSAHPDNLLNLRFGFVWVEFNTPHVVAANSQPKLIGLVWGLAATRRSVYIHQMNRVNSRNDFGHDDSGQWSLQ